MGPEAYRLRFRSHLLEAQRANPRAGGGGADRGRQPWCSARHDILNMEGVKHDPLGFHSTAHRPSSVTGMPKYTEVGNVQCENTGSLAAC